MVTLSFSFPLLIFIVGLIRFTFKCKHLLLILLRLEYIVLSLYIIIFLIFYNFRTDYYFSLVFISIIVCERSLGLSILVIIVRSYGNDYFQSLRIL